MDIVTLSISLPYVGTAGDYRDAIANAMMRTDAAGQMALAGLLRCMIPAGAMPSLDFTLSVRKDASPFINTDVP